MTFISGDIKKIKNLDVHSLPPTPPQGSNCDFIINDSPLCGGLTLRGGSNKQWFAESFNTERGPIKSYAIQIARDRTLTEPIIFGIVKNNVKEDMQLLLDTENWESHAVVYPNLLPQINTFYWFQQICNIPKSWDYWLITVTNQTTDGWMVGAFCDDHSTEELHKYYDGQWWSLSDLDMCLATYTEGGEPEEGKADITNIDFPANANVGEPYDFSFVIYNEKQFSCGCPEDLFWWIKDRDSGQEVIPRQDFTLSCEDDYEYISQAILFGSMGTFHGKLQAGHMENSTPVIDETHNFDVTISALPCSDYTNQSDCIAAGCYWYDDSCHSEPQQGITLEKAIMVRDDTWSCDPYGSGCYCGDEGPQENTFPYPDQPLAYSYMRGDIYGVRFRHDWFYDFGYGPFKVRQIYWDPCPYSNGYCTWSFPDIVALGNGIGIVGIFGNDQYLGQTNQFQVTGAPQGTATAYMWNKEPKIGPFTPGQETIIGSFDMKNTADTPGRLYMQTVRNPGTEYETTIFLYAWWFDPDEMTGVGINQKLPTSQGVYTYGARIWGEGKNVPSWGQQNTMIWDVYVGIDPPCEEYQYQQDCTSHGCYWYNGSCHSEQQPQEVLAELQETSIYYTGPFYPGNIVIICEARVKNIGGATGKLSGKLYFNPNTIDETLEGGASILEVEPNEIWVYNAVKSLPVNLPQGILSVGIKVYGEDEEPPDWSDQTKTHMWDVTIQPLNCEMIPFQTDCEQAECYWYDEACHSYPEGLEICQWILDRGGIYDLHIVEVMLIIDAYIYQNPIEGYSFIPTIEQVFGIIDYYLGFDGDQGTGCDFIP